MKAIIIARVSTEEQKEAGNSLPAQIARMEKHCQNKGFTIIKKFSFDESAYKTKRNDFDKKIGRISCLFLRVQDTAKSDNGVSVK